MSHARLQFLEAHFEEARDEFLFLLDERADLSTSDVVDASVHLAAVALMSGDPVRARVHALTAVQLNPRVGAPPWAPEELVHMLDEARGAPPARLVFEEERENELALRVRLQSPSLPLASRLSLRCENETWSDTRSGELPDVRIELDSAQGRLQCTALVTTGAGAPLLRESLSLSAANVPLRRAWKVAVPVALVVVGALAAGAAVLIRNIRVPDPQITGGAVSWTE